MTDQTSPGVGHNSDMEKFIQDQYQKLASIDAQRKILNDQAADIRDAFREKGHDPKAFHDQYTRAKRKRSEKEGYDETASICLEALNKMNTGNLFKFMDKPEKTPKPEKVAKPPKSPKKISGKDAAAGGTLN